MMGGSEVSAPQEKAEKELGFRRAQRANSLSSLLFSVSGSVKREGGEVFVQLNNPALVLKSGQIGLSEPHLQQGSVGGKSKEVCWQGQGKQGSSSYQCSLVNASV